MFVIITKHPQNSGFIELYDRPRKRHRHHRGRTSFLSLTGEIRKATGIQLPEDGSVADFAQGLVRASKRKVKIFDSSTRLRPQQYYVKKSNDPVSLAFFALGFSWGRGEWRKTERFLQSLRLTPAQKFELLEDVGAFFCKTPGSDSPMDFQVVCAASRFA